MFSDCEALTAEQEYLFSFLLKSLPLFSSLFVSNDHMDT